MSRVKLTAIAAALIGVSALSTSVTTAYLMRRAASVIGPTAAAAAVQPAVSVAAVSPQPFASVAPRAVSRPAVVTSASRPAPRIVRASATQTACGSTADRLLRIAKPGAIGALIGAGVGAAGGAVAKGGQGAGKGAVIGGLAGAVLGGGYGAYQTKAECGSVLGLDERTRTFPVYAAR